MENPEPVNRASARASLLGRLVLGGAALVVCPAWAATVVHSPYLQNMRGDGVTIVWSTRERIPAAVVQYSTDQSFSRSVSPNIIGPYTLAIPNLTFYQYRADLPDLAADTPYNYRVLMDGTTNGTTTANQFHTPGADKFRFLAFGDSGAGTPEQTAVLQQMLKEQPDLVLHVGDIAYENGTFDEFTERYFAYYFSMMAHLPFFPVPGNHEYQTPNAVPYLALHAPPIEPVPDFDKGRYYSYDWGNTHFVALDANLLDIGFSAAAELDWLKRDLAATTAKWKIVYWHQVPYPLLHHVGDPICVAAQKYFVPILEQYGVQLVLTGHEHEYFRSKPMHGNVPVSSGSATVYITTGGGGGQLHPVAPQPWVDYSDQMRGLAEAKVYHYLSVEVNSTQITVHAIDKDGNEFDRGTLSENSPLGPPSIDPDGVVNAASFTSSLAVGGLVSIFGQELAGDSQPANYPLPAVVAGSTVTLDGTPLSLLYVSRNQINAQLPLNVQGTRSLRVTTSKGVAEVPVLVSDTAPAVFVSGILHANGTVVSASAPAASGETLVVFLTGLGQVNGPIAAGQQTPLSPLYTVVNPVQVDIGTATVTPAFAGLTPGCSGVYQVNVMVPPDLPPNVYPLRVVIQGNLSNVTNIQVVRGRNP